MWLSGGTVPPNNSLSGGTVPPNNSLSGGTVPPDNSLSGGTMSKGSLRIIRYPAGPYQRGIKGVPPDYLLSGGTFEIHCFKSDVTV